MLIPSPVCIVVFSIKSSMEYKHHFLAYIDENTRPDEDQSRLERCTICILLHRLRERLPIHYRRLTSHPSPLLHPRHFTSYLFALSLVYSSSPPAPCELTCCARISIRAPRTFYGFADAEDSLWQMIIPRCEKQSGYLTLPLVPIVVTAF